MCKFSHLLFMFVAAILSACSSASIDEQMANASVQFATGDLEGCSSTCNEILSDSVAFNSLSVEQLCKLSEILISLEGDLEANDASAARCLSRARSLNADSVEMFISSASQDVSYHLAVLDRVGAYLGIPRDSLVSTEDFLGDISLPDSITSNI